MAVVFPRTFMFALSLLFSTHAIGQEATPAPVLSPASLDWGLDDSDLPVDPAIRFGRLDNGMRYAIWPNKTPRGTVAIRMRIAMGSLAEAEDQRGLAHFVEHMAFNGTTHVPEGDMVKILERHGLAFGADTNASTGTDQTIYMLDLPKNDAPLIDTALFLMRETASEISFLPDAVDRERGVVLSELRGGENYQRENFEAYRGFIAPDSRVTQRMPIGLAPVIATAPATRLRDYYDSYYTPGRTTLIVVGDVDPDALEILIREKFADWTAKFGEAPDPFPGTIANDRTAETYNFVHPAVAETVTLSRMAAYVDEPDTVANRRRTILRSIGLNIVNRRLDRIARKSESPFLNASISSGNVDDLARQSSLSVSTADGQWATGLAAAETEVRKALQYGFSDREIAEQVAILRKNQVNTQKGAGTRRNAALAGLLLNVAENGTIPTTPQSGLERFEAFEPFITALAVHAEFQQYFQDLANPLIYIASKAPLENVGVRYAAMRESFIEKPAQIDAKTLDFADFGPPGNVVTDTRDPLTGIRLVTFANNVRLNIKKTDFEDNRVRLSLRVDGGDLLATRDNPHATALMNIFADGGLESNSVDELQSLLAGRSVSLDFGSGTDYFGTYSVTVPDDLELQMRLLAAYLTAPGYRPEAVDQYRRGLPQYYARLDATPAAALSSRTGAILSDGDPRYTLVDQRTADSLDFDKLKANIADRLAHGAIEIGLVGDVDEDSAIDIIAHSFGALPAREASFQPYSASRDRHFTNQAGSYFVFHTGGEDQAITQHYWPTTDDSDPRADAALSLLSDIMQLELTDVLREQLGTTYSPGASSFTSSIFPGLGYLSVTGSPDYADLSGYRAAVDGIINRLTSDLVDADTLQRARSPVLERITLSQSNNSYWLGLTAIAQSKPERLARARQLDQVYRDITPDDIRNVARKYLKTDYLVEITALHASKQQQIVGQGDDRTGFGEFYFQPPPASRTARTSAAVSAITADDAKQE